MTGEARLKAFCALRVEFSHGLKDEVEKGPENQHNKNIGLCFGKSSKGFPARGGMIRLFFICLDPCRYFYLPLSA